MCTAFERVQFWNVCKCEDTIVRQKTFLKSLLGAPTLVGASLLMAAATVAAESPTTDELLSPVADVQVEAEAALEKKRR